MTPFQTYAERKTNADPYALFEEPMGRKRRPRRRRIFSADFNVLGNAPSLAGGVNLAPGLTVGSLSSVTIFVSHACTERPQELAEMLRSLEMARAKADPYVEIDENTRALIGKRFEQRLEKILETAAAESRAQQSAEKKLSLEEFLQPVLQLEKHGRIDSALDALYDRVDDLLKSGEFETLDDLLRQAKVESLPADILLGLLTATLPARSRLSARRKFFADVEASIKARGAWEHGLLAGLES